MSRTISVRRFNNLLTQEHTELTEDLYIETSKLDSVLEMAPYINVMDYSVNLTGTFDGNGYTIHNCPVQLYYTIEEDAKFKNVNITVESDITLESIVCRNNDGVIKNVDVTIESKVKDTDDFGVIARSNNGIIENCVVSGTVIGKNVYFSCGGIVTRNTEIIRDCTVNSSLVSSVSCGGVAKMNSGEIINCTSTSSVLGQGPVGGIAGDNSGEIKNCLYKDGNIDSKSGKQYYGGISGVNHGSIIESSCENITVTGQTGTGGLVGLHTGFLKKCYIDEKSKISGKEYVGGIFGRGKNSTVEKCISEAEVTGKKYIGGIGGNCVYSDCDSLLFTGCLPNTNTKNKKFKALVFGIIKESEIQRCIYNGYTNNQNLVGNKNTNGVYESTQNKDRVIGLLNM